MWNVLEKTMLDKDVMAGRVQPPGKTGEIMLTRDELAEKVGETTDNVSGIMRELEKFGAISRRRAKVAGLRGPGMVR